jgi:predicted nucleic acid-binding protein
MFDTNVFNRILDGGISPSTLSGYVVAYATHVQRDELQRTRDPARREALTRVFRDITTDSVATSSAVVGVSRIDECRSGGDRVVPTTSAVYGVSQYGGTRYGDGFCSALRSALDNIKRKPNNIQDALIAETAIKGGLVLVTDDADLAAVAKQYGGACLSVPELLQRCNFREAT